MILCIIIETPKSSSPTERKQQFNVIFIFYELKYENTLTRLILVENNTFPFTSFHLIHHSNYKFYFLRLIDIGIDIKRL